MYDSVSQGPGGGRKDWLWSWSQFKVSHAPGICYHDGYAEGKSTAVRIWFLVLSQERPAQEQPASQRALGRTHASPYRVSRAGGDLARGDGTPVALVTGLRMVGLGLCGTVLSTHCSVVWVHSHSQYSNMVISTHHK